MGSRAWALMLLCALQGATSLSVQQWPVSLRVTWGGEATLACQVTQAQAWERLRVEWTKDSDVICQLLLTNGTQSPGVCGTRAQLSWQPPGDMKLRLHRLTLSDSGAYVCRVTVEIPELEKAEGNRTQLLVDADGTPHNQDRTPGLSGLLWALLVAGSVVVPAVSALGLRIWGLHSRRRRDAGNPLYSNVLYRARDVPQRSKAWPGERKPLDTAPEGPKGQVVYSTSFPQPSTSLPQPAPKPHASPRPD